MKKNPLRKRKIVDYRFYYIWLYMLRRCNKPKCNTYKHYGARGIKVCKEWELYDTFHEDMFYLYNLHRDKYGVKQTTLDRIDVNGNYCKENCRWATYKVQGNNRRNNLTSKVD